ncbi:MAG: hypothetical protein H0W70_04745 [Actinobacteria bacterium]|nr:hypothetical protein [Actinomycetota bacterium]
MDPAVSPRTRHMGCGQHPSSLEDVVAALTEASRAERIAYVERGVDGWRWSLAHKGGPYPLLRITARFLQVDHRRVMVPTRSLPNGYCVWGDIADNPGAVWRMIELDKKATPRSITDAVETASPATDRPTTTASGRRPR